MMRLLVPVLALVLAASVAMLGCSQAAPAPAPTQAPAAPKAAEPTKPPAQAVLPTAPPAAAQPTAPASAKVAFPEKGKAISIIVPFSAGGSTDTQARLLASILEKDLGTPVQVESKPGAGSQIGLTALAQAKPDGYTIGFTNNPTSMGVYLNPERKANLSRKSFEPIASFVFDPEVIGVKADAPFKNVKDLVDAAKAKPKTIKATTNGILSDDHMAILQVEKVGGCKFAIVHFDGSAEAVAALLGGKVDAVFGGIGSLLPHSKAGTARILGIMDEKESAFLPGVPTLESQGYKIYFGSSRGLSAPAGTPKEIVNILSAAIKRAMETEEFTKKVTDMGNTLRYMPADQYAKFWDDMEAVVKPLVEEALKEK